MKKKILYITNIDKFFLSHRIEIATESKKFFDIYLATKFTSKKKIIEKKKIQTFDLFLDRKSLNIFSNLITMINILYIIIKIKPDIIHFVSIKPVLLGGIISRLFKKIPKVFSITGLGFVFTEKNFFSKIRIWFFIKFYKKSLNHKNFKIILQNHDDMKFFKNIISVRQSNLKLIAGSGVNTNKFKPEKLNLTKPKVILPARMLYHKGILEFIEAVKILQKEKIKASFILVGELDKENPSFIDLEKINSWVKDGIVKYWGFKKNMNKILNMASIVVLPSYREGFPKVLMEAASCGRPVITTNVPGCKNAIINNVTGILVPKKNSHELANKIKYLLLNKYQIKKMGLSARRFAVKNFDVKHVVNDHINLYKGLLDK